MGEYNAMYNHRWRKRRAIFLRNHPLCNSCSLTERPVKADVVDHITPHKGDQVLFWDEGNWQALCYNCHNSAKQRLENRGYDSAVGLDGWPTDEKHPVNRGFQITGNKQHRKGRKSAENT